MRAARNRADSQEVPVNVLTVTLAAFATALATGLGALPFRWLPSTLRIWNPLAAALMLIASASLVWQGWALGVGRLLLGAGLGALFIVLVGRLIPDRPGVVLIGAMTAHSAAEGIGVGVSYGGGQSLGVFVTLLIALHNIPEGLAISAVLVPRGVSVGRAAWWSVFSSLPQPLVAPLAFLFVEEFRSLLPAGLGFAAGAMVWMVWAELLPDLRSSRARRHAAQPH
jgi:zinc transporter ZupT